MTAFYSHTGRPSIDPELMMRMLIVGYCYGIRSERKLCEEVSLNLAYRWFCRLNLNDAVPDHSTFSKHCHSRFRDSDLRPLLPVTATPAAKNRKSGIPTAQPTEFFSGIGQRHPSGATM
jgi:hypothetical protein